MKPRTIRDVTIGEVQDAYQILMEAQKALGHTPILPHNIIVPIRIEMKEEDRNVAMAAKKILED